MIEEGDQAEEVDGLLGGDICKFHTSENHDTFTGKLSFSPKSFIPIKYCHTQQYHFEEAFLVDGVAEFIS